MLCSSDMDLHERASLAERMSSARCFKGCNFVQVSVNIRSESKWSVKHHLIVVLGHLWKILSQEWGCTMLSIIHTKKPIRRPLVPRVSLSFEQRSSKGQANPEYFKANRTFYFCVGVSLYLHVLLRNLRKGRYKIRNKGIIHILQVEKVQKSACTAWGHPGDVCASADLWRLMW